MKTPRGTVPRLGSGVLGPVGGPRVGPGERIERWRHILVLTTIGSMAAVRIARDVMYPYLIGFDGRLYVDASRVWLAGGDPWAATYELRDPLRGPAAIAPRDGPTDIPGAGRGRAGDGGRVWRARLPGDPLLGLPAWWILWAPILDGVLVGSLDIATMALPDPRRRTPLGARPAAEGLRGPADGRRAPVASRSSCPQAWSRSRSRSCRGTSSSPTSRWSKAPSSTRRSRARRGRSRSCVPIFARWSGEPGPASRRLSRGAGPVAADPAALQRPDPAGRLDQPDPDVWVRGRVHRAGGAAAVGRRVYRLRPLAPSRGSRPGGSTPCRPRCLGPLGAGVRPQRAARFGPMTNEPPELDVVVLGGGGHVGLPLSLAFADAGLTSGDLRHQPGHPRAHLRRRDAVHGDGGRGAAPDAVADRTAVLRLRRLDDRADVQPRRRDRDAGRRVPRPVHDGLRDRPSTRSRRTCAMAPWSSCGARSIPGPRPM